MTYLCRHCGTHDRNHTVAQCAERLWEQGKGYKDVAGSSALAFYMRAKEVAK